MSDVHPKRVVSHRANEGFKSTGGVQLTKGDLIVSFEVESCMGQVRQFYSTVLTPSHMILTEGGRSQRGCQERKSPTAE
jgi:hypothetical protein